VEPTASGGPASPLRWNDTKKKELIEHRLFAYSSSNWRGRPLACLAVIVNLIAAGPTSVPLRLELHHSSGPAPPVSRLLVS